MKSNTILPVFRLLVILTCMSFVPVLSAQTCFEVDLGKSRIMLDPGGGQKVPDNGDTLEISCNKVVSDVRLVMTFLSGSERYFEDSTEFVALLFYKSSTIIMTYDKGANTFSLPSDSIDLLDGQYSVNITANRCSPSGTACNNCDVSYAFHVGYNGDSIPTIDFTTTPSPPLLTCYPGSVVQLTGPAPPTNAYKAQWARLINSALVNIPGATSPTYPAAFAGTYQYTLSGPAGCSNSNFIAVSPPLLPTATVQPDTQTLVACAQKIADAAVSNVGNAGNAQYAWSASAGGILLDGSNTLTPLIGAPGTYTLTVTRQDNGCSATASVTAIAGNIPTVTVKIERDPAAGNLDCRLTEMELMANASVSSGSSAFGFLWSGGETTPVITADEPGVYSVTVTALSNGCQGKAELIVNQDISKPVIQILSARDTICAGESILLTALSQEPTTFLWNDNSTGSTLMATPSQNGANPFTVVATAGDNGCTNTAVRWIERVPIPEVDCPMPDLTVQNGDQASLNCSTSGDRIIWQATSINVRNIAATGQGAVLNQVFALIDAQAPGVVDYGFYAVNAGCASTELMVRVTVLPSTEDGIYIPELITPDGDGQNDTWEIVFPPSVTNPSAYSVQLFNRYGALVYEGTLDIPFEAANYPDGAYYYVIKKPDGGALKGAVTILRRL